jgi:hypothetical protein
MERYYNWLCDLVEIKQRDKSYWLLSNELFNKDFYWSVPNDDNRAFEAKNLREQFCEEVGLEYDLDDFPEEVSMFELIIGLAYRCYSIMEDTLAGMEMSDWFWKILSNVGLDKYTDDAFYGLKGQELVVKILDKIIDRDYERSGKGGLFPLKYSKKDQRKVELWYQMNEYLVENYYSGDLVM